MIKISYLYWQVSKYFVIYCRRKLVLRTNNHQCRSSKTYYYSKRYEIPPPAWIEYASPTNSRYTALLLDLCISWRKWDLRTCETQWAPCSTWRLACPWSSFQVESKLSSTVGRRPGRFRPTIYLRQARWILVTALECFSWYKLGSLSKTFFFGLEIAMLAIEWSNWSILTGLFYFFFDINQSDSPISSLNSNIKKIERIHWQRCMYNVSKQFLASIYFNTLK